MTHLFIRGTNLVAKYSFFNGAKSEYTYYTQNAHGDVVNLTDAEGNVTKTYTYDAFGVEKNIDESDTNAFRYCGEYYDAETGTIYLRARYYNPLIGRFITRDSYAGKLSDPLSLNLYTYCHNNPLFYLDPTGHNAWTDFWDEAVDCWMVGSSGFREAWNIGNNDIASSGKAGELAACFNQGVVDTLGGQAESIVKTVRNPGKAIKNVADDYVAYGKKDWNNWLPTNYLASKLVDGFAQQWQNSYNLGLNYGLNGVAYGLGQGTTSVAETGIMAYGSQMLTNALSSSQKGLNWDIVNGKGETRFQHVAKHMSNNLQKPNHGVFYGDAVSTINEAWEIGLNQGIQPITVGNVDKYFIPYPNSGYAGGYAGQGNNWGYVTIITKTNTNQIITGYPSGLG